MNRDLKNEYKQLITDEAPDLWVRIEAGLEPKKKKKKPVRFWTFAAAAAACACVVITLPAIMMSGGYSSNGTSSGSTASNSASTSAGSSPVYSTSDGMDTAAIQENSKAQMSGGVDNSASASAADAAAAYEAEMDYRNELETDMQVFVQILGVTVEDDVIIYFARVESSDSETLKEDAEIKIYSNAINEVLFEEGERCELQLIPLEIDKGMPAFYMQNN